MNREGVGIAEIDVIARHRRDRKIKGLRLISRITLICADGNPKFLPRIRRCSRIGIWGETYAKLG